MTVRDVLDLMDDEVWVRVRVNDADGKTNDLVLWSADWIGGGEDDPGMPDGLADVLGWDADDLSIEMYDDPEFQGIPGPEDRVPMLVVNAYNSDDSDDLDGDSDDSDDNLDDDDDIPMESEPGYPWRLGHINL